MKLKLLIALIFVSSSLARYGYNRVTGVTHYNRHGLGVNHW